MGRASGDRSVLGWSAGGRSRAAIRQAATEHAEPDLIDEFSIIAEVAVGLAGFAGVAVILGRGPGRWSPGDAVRIRLLLYSAFGALFASLLPIGLLLVGASPALAIRCTAGALIVVLVSFGVVGARALRDQALRRVLDPRVARVLRAAAVLVGAAQSITVLGLGGPASPGMVYLGLVALLGYAAFGFVRLMFIRPTEE